MSRNTWQYAWAALLAALVVGCDLTEPPVPPVVQILFPAVDGQAVNETVPPETPFWLQGRITRAGRPLSGTWTLNGVTVGTGDSVLVAPGVGSSHTTTLTALDDGLTAEARRSFRIDPDTIAVRTLKPEDGAVFREGTPIPCDEEITFNPRHYQASTAWSANGTSALCGQSRTLVVQAAPPVEFFPPPGAYPVIRTTCALGRPTRVCDIDTVGITVRPRPDQIVFTWVTPGEERDFWTFDVDDPKNTLTRLTRDGTTKHWAELSPDGKMLVYTRPKEPCGFLPYLANLDGSNEQVIGWGPTFEQCQIKGTGRSPRWSPDGKTIALIGSWDPPEIPGVQLKFTIYLVDVASRTVKHLNVRTCRGHNEPQPCFDAVTLEIAFHPNGRGIVTGLWEGIGGEGVGRIVVVNIELTGAITRFFTSRLNQDPQRMFPNIEDISSNGSLVAFWAQYAFQEDAPRIGIIRADGSGEFWWLTPRQNDPAPGPRWPVFCDGGKYVYYVADDRNVLRRVKPDGTGDEVVLALPAFGQFETPRCHRAR